MSLPQSRSDKSDTPYRKLGRSGSSGNQQRGFSGRGGGSSGGGFVPPPASSLSSNRSYKKSNNAQGGQPRTSVSNVNTESSNVSAQQRTVQNGAHLQPPLHASSDVSVTGIAAKPAESSSTQKSNQAVPKAPSSQSTTMNSDTAVPTTPAKPPGDASTAFSLQFGSISPGFMNGMQIPARTSSAPPNLDEQKRDQARHGSFKSGPMFPIPPVPKQPLPRKDSGMGRMADQSNTAEAHTMSKAKKDAQVSSAPTLVQTQKTSVPMAGTPMQMPFHQPHVPVQYGVPNPQIQSQGLIATSLQMPLPMPLPMGNASQVHQQVFVPNLQPHPMLHQGMMHQGQSMSFTAQMGPQIPPQLGNLGTGMAPQFPHLAGKFGGARRPVKITDPKTLKDVRLDQPAETSVEMGSTGPKSHSNVPQSQPNPSFTPHHQMNYYPNAYNANSVFFTAPSSLPLTSSQVTPSSQAARFNYSVSQGSQPMSFVNPSTHNSISSNKISASLPETAELSNVERARDVHSLTPSSPFATIQVSVKPAAGYIREKVADSSLPINSPTVGNGDSPKLLRPPGEAGSFHSQRGTENYSESSIQQPKPGVGVSVFSAMSMALAGKQPAGASTSLSVDRAGSNTSSTPSLALEGTSSVLTITDGWKKETISRSSSIKDHQKPGEKGNSQSQPQVAGQCSSILRLPSLALDHKISSSSGVPETVESKTTFLPTATSEGELDSTSAPLSNIVSAAPAASESNTDDVREGPVCEPIKVFGSRVVIDILGAGHEAEQDRFKLQDGLKKENVETEEKESIKLLEVRRKDTCDSEISFESISAKSAVVDTCTELDPVQIVTSTSDGATLGVIKEEDDEHVSCQTEIDNVSDNLLMSNSSGSLNCDSSPLSPASFTISDGDEASIDASSNICKGSIDVSVAKSDKELAPDLPLYLSESNLKNEGECVDNIGGELVSIPDSKDKLAIEPSRAKNTVLKSKKKKKEVLQRADAAGTTSDLYMAYKGQDEKKDASISSEITSISIDLKQEPTDATQKEDVASERGVQSKAEPDDWEDAADISTPKLEASDNGELGHINGNEILTKKYSRDFLLKFAEQCTDLPKGFEITSDIEALIGATDRVSHPSPGKIVDRSTGASRPERRGSVVDDDKWSKFPGPFASGRDPRLDIGYGGNVVGLRPGQGGNFGVLRNPRAQASVQYAGGILSGPMQSMGSQGGMQRNSPDADRWQRATDFQKGLIPSPHTHTPLQVMHRTERKYEIGKVSNEEEAKQRQLKAILNKLTPQNFEKLFQQVQAVNIDNAITLTGVISQIFDKALTEPTFCEMYADFCHHLAGELPDFSEDNEKITFRRLLLNKCQEEFERGEREQEEANRVEEGEIKQSKEEREEKRIQARRRMLGNIRLIGELYKKKMLTERIMHSCINKLLGQNQNPDVEDIESLCKLMSTIGEMIDHPKAKEHIDAYFDIMANLSNNMKFSSRVRFMLKDAIDLRKNKWQQRRKVEGPKKIEEVHRDAAQERHAQAQVGRLARGPSISSSVRRDFGPRGSTMLSSPSTQMGNFRGFPPQVRGYGNQDVRSEERQSYEARHLSVSLPQRPVGDDSITLGPQGGLARGMSNRGPPAMSSVSLADLHPSPVDSRRMTGGVNGYNASTDQTTYGSKEFLMPRYVPERLVSPSAYDQSSGQERNMPYGNRDLRNPERSFDRPLATSPPTRVQGHAFTQNNISEVLPEGRLREMSISAIREFYSAKDKTEVTLCIKDLNSPSFHPAMISLWVTDSFERKDMERDLLAKLLVDLVNSRDGLLTQHHLLKGFESALTTLEDAVNDAPKAAEFMGRIFAKTILENVIPIEAIGQLIYTGGEEPGSLLEIGLAADILGSILEIIQSEKGDIVLNEIRSSSSLQWVDFRPPAPMKSRKLEKFI